MQAAAILLLATTLCVVAYDLETVYKWKYIDFNYPSEQFKQNFIKWGHYNLSNILPNDVNQAPDGRMFVSIHGRRGSHIPLATVTKHIGPSGPLLQPYPSWEFYGFKDESYTPKIHSVYRTAFDKCNRMWIIDQGYYMDDHTQNHGQAKLYIFDLKTDKIYKEVAIPEHLYGSESWLLSHNVYPVIETHGSNCENSYAYIANMNRSSLIVYDDKANKFHHYEDATFEPDLEAKDFSIVDTEDEPLEGGFLQLTLIPVHDEYDSYLLYYRPLVSAGFYAVNTTTLREQGIKNAKVFEAKNYLKQQAFGQDYSPSESTMFFGLVKNGAIGCWNRYNKNLEMDYVTRNDKRLKYPVMLHILGQEIYGKEDEELLILSKKFVMYHDQNRHSELDNVNFEDYNFFVLRAPVREVVKGTKCVKNLFL